MPDSSVTPPSAARRTFLRGSAAGTTAVGLFAGGLQQQAAAQTVPQTGLKHGNVDADAHPTIRLSVNGKQRTLTVEPRTTLVEALRDTLG